jgi:hypothetical protein
MFRRVAYLAATAATILVLLSGCAFNFQVERREAWRAEADRACLLTRPFRRDDFITETDAIRERRVCGLRQPLSVAALNDGTVVVGPAATIGCPMTVALEQWLAAAVQPSALARLGSQVVSIEQISAYACRGRNGQPDAELSEHAFGNALDIASFQLADGRVVSIEDHWYGGTQAEQDFLREIHGAACHYFTTVLGPGVEYHSDHFHFDLARHNANGTSRYCRPTPVSPPMRQYVAGAGTPAIGYANPTAAAPAPFTDGIGTFLDGVGR